MNNYFSRLLKTFDYHSHLSFFQSLVPSHKYNLTIVPAAISVLYAPIDKIFGLDAIAFLGLLVVLFTELVSGLIASRIRKEQFSSMKLSRFAFKVAVYLVLIFVPHSFAVSFKNHNDDVPAWIFDWLRIFLITQIVYENIVSILENLAVITGNDKTAWINKIQSFLANAINLIGTKQ